MNETTMNTQIPEALLRLVTVAESRTPLGDDAAPATFVADTALDGRAMYMNRNERLNIDFRVERLGFPDIQVMDPRVLRIAPGRNNELHKHAHESIFVVLEGEGSVRIGDAWVSVKKGSVAFVPRWIFHQSRNTSTTNELVILAITDFGFTSALLGDYDQRTRLAQDGADSKGV